MTRRRTASTRVRRDPRVRAPRAAEPPPGPVPRTPFDRWIGWLLLVCGTVGAAASLVLVLDRIALLENPFHVPSCSIDAVLSCGSIMTSAQSEVLGFPNPLLGLAAFPVVATVGVAAIGAAPVSRTLWLGLQVGALAGVVFAHWLVAQSLYSIGALCPHCMIVWVVTITAFWYTTLYNALAGHLRLPSSWERRAARIAQYHGAVLASWLAAIATLVAVRFWPYWTGAVTS